jgi:sec-independent protein translocase protein TatB
MLDVGFSEILLTSAIALIVLGPERLPKVARQVGNWVGRARAMARQLSEQLEREVSADELLKAHTKASVSAATSSASAEPASSGAAFDSSYSPSIAPPAVALPADTAATVPPSAPEPTYGLDAAATTPAAMHASDSRVADPKPPHE